MSFTYRGLEAVLERHTVTGEEVDRQLERVRQQHPRIAAVTDRAAQLGDELVLDYAGFCDGEQFAGGTAKMQTLVLGSGMFIPGFEEQLVDKVPGEAVTVNVTFPESYHAEDLAGKAAQFQCVIHEIRVKTEYELDDVFAKEVGGCETFGQMWEKMRQSLQDYSNDRGEMELQDRLLRQAAETLEFQPTEKQISAELDAQMENLSAQLAQQGLNLDMYCQFLNTTKEQLREDARANAIQSVRCQAAIEEIVSAEGLEATQEDIGEALAVIARQNKMTVEELKPYYDAQFEAAVVRSILTSKVTSLIREAATVTEKEA